MTTTHSRSRRGLFFLLGMGCAILIGFVVWFTVVSVNEARLNRALIVDSHTVLNEMRAIAESLANYASREGEFPRSFADWARTEPNLASLLTTQSASTTAGYAIDFDALGDPGRIVTMSPDRDIQRLVPDGPFMNWRGAYRYATGHGPRVIVRGNATADNGSSVPYEKRRAFAIWAGWSFNERIPSAP